MKIPTHRDEVLALDALDPLAKHRELFFLPDDIVYLVGHSLGPSSHPADKAVKTCLEQEWRDGMVGSWNSAGWFDMAKSLGTPLARLIGADPKEVMVTDTVSVNLFKLAIAALPLARSQEIYIDQQEFPTDQYMADSIARISGIPCHRCTPGNEGNALNSGGIYIKSAVNYRSCERIDIKAYEDRAALSGTLIVWDLSHATGVISLEMQASGAKLATGCTYKYLNAGPGAPAFVYIRQDMVPQITSPLPGWMGHARPFAFEPKYAPTGDSSRFASGTPPILSLNALRGALSCFDQVSVSDLQDKAGKLGELCIGLAKNLGLKVSSPENAKQRGGHVSIEIENGYAISRALHDMGFHTDFRTPTTIRFGMSPLYIRYVDVWDLMQTLKQVLDEKLWDNPAYQKQNKVT